jgi:endonuclease/exonuclease/phosphatase family metal-dependent hydrolase
MKKLIFFFLIIIGNALSAQTNLKLMTYNIRYDNPNDGENRWDLRKEWLANQVSFVGPDVMGIQEGLAHQVNFLDENLKDFKYVGIGRDDGKTKGEYSAIFYDYTKLNLVDQNTFWLSEIPEKISVGWDASMERICTYALFEDKTTKDKFWVFNAHFDHIGEIARANSIDLILQKIKGLNRQNLPVFFMGDLNLEPESEPIQNLSIQMKDAFHSTKNPAFGPTGTFNGFKHDRPVTRRIDYIFTGSSGIEVNKYGVLSDSKDLKYPSDHLPVVIEAIIKP